MNSAKARSQSLVASPKRRTTPSVPTFFSGLVVWLSVSAVLGVVFGDLDWLFLLLVSLSTSFASADIFEVFKGQRPFFSPRALVSLLMVNSAFIAPVIHIVTDLYPRYVVLPTDITQAMTNLALLQLLGHAVYFFACRIFSKKQPELEAAARSPVNNWDDLKKVRFWLSAFAILSLGLFIYTILLSGGPSAWLASQLNYREDLVASGTVLSLAEAFPTLFFIVYVLSLKMSRLTRRQQNHRIVIAFIILMGLIFITSGLRGSRANVVWPALSAIVLIHLLFFKVRAQTIAIVAIIGLAFAGVYDVYKKTGPEGVESFQSGTLETTGNMTEYGFGLPSMILGDFSRAGTQMLVLDRWGSGAYSPYMGATYVGGTLQFVPGVEPYEAFPTKRVASTEILYGQGAASTGDNLSSRIYGLQGEALINFGFLGAILIFIPYSIIISRAESLYARALKSSRISISVFIALLMPAFLLLFLSDLDNVIRNLTSSLLLPLLAFFCAKILTRNR